MPEALSEKRVLIVGGADSPEANLVAAALRTLGADVARCDTAGFPEDCRLSIRRGSILMGDKPLRTPRTVYVRGLAAHPLAPAHADDLAHRARGLVAQCDEKRAFLESMLLILKRRGAKLVNGLRANSQHSRKPWQLDALEERGILVPRWLVTNNPDHLREFAESVDDVVYKPLAGGAPVRRLEVEDLLPERLESLRLAPVLFQQYIAGTPLRAYVVGRRIVAAAEILAPGVDSREDTREVRPVRLTPAERSVVLSASATCGMSFAAVDCIRATDGLVVLECNPSPMFAAFEELTGLRVGAPLADLLVAGRRD